MNTLIQFVTAHPTPFLLALGWVFSAACSTMPPLSPEAGFWTTWAHNFIQALAANANKITIPKGSQSVSQNPTQPQ